MFIQDKGNIDEIEAKQDSLRQIKAIKQKEIESLKLRCNTVQEEKENFILELKQTQVMSTEKLLDLATKQDLLEIENTQTSVGLIESENKNSELDKQGKMLHVTLQSGALILVLLNFSYIYSFITKKGINFTVSFLIKANLIIYISLICFCYKRRKI